MPQVARRASVRTRQRSCLRERRSAEASGRLGASGHRERFADTSGSKANCPKPGHLKRWYFFGDEVKQKYGKDAEIYRCEHCKTLYLPNAEEAPRTGTLSY